MNEQSQLSSPARTGDLVLRTRLGLLLRNLDQVRTALATVKERRADFGQLLMLPFMLKELLADLDSYHELAWGSFQRGSRPPQETALKEMRGLLTGVAKVVDGAGAAAARLQTRGLPKDHLSRTAEVAKAVHESLENEIRHTFGERLAKVRGLRQAISVAPGSSPDPTSDALREAWAVYTNDMLEGGERLFAEYVELVAGIAMRDAEYDRGLCQIAEDVLAPLAKIGNFTWNNLTIPAHRETTSATAARVVRLGFPEWTIWTLPLAAQELANDFLARDPEVMDIVRSQNADREEVCICLSDAFATYFMGPAYACALLLMRLDPSARHDGDRIDSKRAATVLTVLRRMSTAERKSEDQYRAITGRIAVEWEDALRQNGWEGPPEADPDVDLGGQFIEADEQEAVRRCTGLTSAEAVMVQHWVEELDPLLWTKRLNIGQWPRVKKIGDLLRSRGDIPRTELDKLDESRYVLNAAWLARVAVKAGENDIDDQAVLTSISEAAEAALWHLSEREAPDARTGLDPGRALGRSPREEPAAPPNLPGFGLAAGQGAS